MPIILALLVAAPLLELFVLIEIGGVIGAGPTIALSLATAAIGIATIRRQGLSVLRDLRSDGQQRASAIGKAMVHGVFLALAGMMLIFPGFVTDTLGALLLIPPIRLILGGGLLSVLRRSGSAGVFYSAHSFSNRADGAPGAPPHTASNSAGQDGPVIDLPTNESDGMRE